jgi:hypothetical protein
MAVSGDDLVNYMKKFIGTPYVWGGTSPNGFDCSGLMQYTFGKFGIKLPRVTYDQIGQGQAVSMKGLRPGDLVFFDTEPGTKGPDHVGMYIGGGKMIDAPRPGKSVEIVDITKGYYADRFMGGRRIAGVTSAGQSSADFATPKDDVKLSPEELASNYGWSVGFLEHNPELKGLFDQAVKGTWTAEKFQAEIRNTKWWKTTSETARQAQALKSTDPATYNAQLSAARMQVQLLASQVGAALPSGQLGKIAESVLSAGLDEDGIRNILGNYVNFTKNGTLTGEAGMHEYTMKQYAASMGVNISDQTLKNQAALVVRKMATTQDFEDQLREQAKSSYPAYANQIDGGQTMMDIATPYMQTMSTELGLPASSITLQDPLIKSALNGLDQNGRPAGKTLLDFTTQLRNDPRWNQTTTARDQAMSVGRKVLNDMGMVS